MTAASRPPDDTPPHFHSERCYATGPGDTEVLICEHRKPEDRHEKGTVVAKETSAPVKPTAGMNEGTRLEGQPGKPVAAEPPLRATSSVSPVVEALDLGAGSTPADAHTQAVAPDDTPTRLEQIQQRFQTGTVRFDDAHWLVAEVSRLQHSLTEKEELLKQIMRTVHVGTFQAAPVAVEGLSESVSRLQQENAAVVSSLTKAISKIEQVVEENALLKRSLEMLTKQMAQDR